MTDRRILLVGLWAALAMAVLGLARPVGAADGGPEPAVALVVDTSGSVARATLARAVATATTVLQGLDPATPAAVVAVSTRATLVSPLTTDRRATELALAGLRPGGDTALFDGIVLAGESLRAHTGPRLVTVFTDGDDTTSTAAEDEAVRALDMAGAEVVGVPLTGGGRLGGDLQSVVDRTSGQVVSDVDPAAVAGALQVLAAALAPPTSAPARPAVTDAPRSPVPGSPTATTPGRTPLLIGAAAVFGALLLAGLLLFEPRVRKATIRRRRDHRAALADLGAAAAELADRAIRRGSKGSAIDRSLENAGIQLRSGEFVAAVGAGAIACGFVGLLLGGPGVGLLFAVASPVGARVYVSIRTDRRREAFAEQLPDTLQLLAGSLRAGYGILQAVDAVAREAESPTSEEFGRLVIEHRLGRGLEDCLWAMAERVDHEDFTWVVQALAIHREVGGDLVQVLETVANTIRERARLRRQVKSLSAEGRISAQILFVLPFLVAAVIRFTNPSYFSLMISTGLGRVLLLAGGCLLAVGGMWMKRLVRPVF